jgi:hypothetical protein
MNKAQVKVDSIYEATVKWRKAQVKVLSIGKGDQGIRVEVIRSLVPGTPQPAHPQTGQQVDLSGREVLRRWEDAQEDHDTAASNLERISKLNLLADELGLDVTFSVNYNGLKITCQISPDETMQMLHRLARAEDVSEPLPTSPAPAASSGETGLASLLAHSL